VKKNNMLDESQLIYIAKGCAQLLEEKKAMDVVLINLMNINTYLDYFIIATSNSIIHSNALAREIQKHLTECGMKARSKADLGSPWILLDFNEIIVHIFTNDARDFYQLEKLWADAEIIKYK
jgi:ribosome-associated protein